MSPYGLEFRQPGIIKRELVSMYECIVLGWSDATEWITEKGELRVNSLDSRQILAEMEVR